MVYYLENLKSNASLLSSWYARLEPLNNSSRNPKSLAYDLHSPFYRGCGVYRPSKSRASILKLLRTRQGFKDQLSLIHSTIDYNYVASVCSDAIGLNLDTTVMFPESPFTAFDIIRWFEAGYFSIDFQIRLTNAPNDLPFPSLGDVMPHWCTNALTTGFIAAKENQIKEESSITSTEVEKRQRDVNDQSGKSNFTHTMRRNGTGFQQGGAREAEKGISESVTFGNKGEGNLDMSTFHGKEEKNYQGMSWFTPPNDANAKSEHCYIPKRMMQTWNGHTKGVLAIRFLLDNNHLLLLAGMDTKVKIWEKFNSDKYEALMEVDVIDPHEDGDILLGNNERQLWKLGTLPPGLITFWKRVYPLERTWHVLGLGYNPSVSHREIEKAAVIHYNGNLKPWLEIGIPKFRGYWNRFLDYDQAYMRDCNMSP
ncbi:unnamed protein product [Lactuca saligna]|uniref:Hexosyltransferase n=1 Tax=Lactuca saligna TaxID=75948 RepID=A0AA35YTK3_LACSI|nr:unnamed protein product [Lactuca saligna]